MCLICSFVPASIFTTIGYFVLVTAGTQNSPGLNLFGLILAIVLFIVALGFIICGLYMTVSGKCPMKKFMESKMGN
ncbi:MAG: hypothetical protein HY529_00265 [Chloroflexi bacterium]|nr:hypothetical protein [Chloroflexota bacterium]